MAAPLVITPQTKVLALLEAYPQLEEVLIARVPAFQKLKNPILRRTVARVATLQQAAAVGGVPVAELVNLLRREVGQDLLAGAAGTAYATERPAWFDPALLAPPVDAGAMLAAGEQPVHRVLTDLKELPRGASTPSPPPSSPPRSSTRRRASASRTTSSRRRAAASSSTSTGTEAAGNR
ncbi:MAG: DUF1858 domain-containing protein [Thermoanaerobaculia bacterium]|nr:DUF1858 domain-containing protein [Thermoanaerobaculia bacterium]